ncbi:MAG TPA: AI-2E family transporter [Feifaniaceae bacterium]|nr:AI-2E family transporter [Feifaniaceae bacterium]
MKKPDEKPENRAVAALKALGSAALGFGKAQLILFGVNFLVITTGMLIAGMKWWSPLIAVGVSLLDLLPVIGSGIVFVPWAVIALILNNTPMAITVGATYIAMVVLRMILDPIITGKNIGLSPLITLLASVAGLIAFGAVGAIIGPAIAAVANIIYRVLFKKKAAAQQTKKIADQPAKTENEPPKG